MRQSLRDMDGAGRPVPSSTGPARFGSSGAGGARFRICRASSLPILQLRQV